MLVSLLLAPAVAAHPDADALRQMVAELAPVVEEVAGRRFETLPEVVLASPTALSEVLFREQVHLLGRLSNLPHEAAEVAAMQSVGALSGTFAGKYGFLDKRLYVVTDGVASAVASRGADPALVGPVLELVVAHELTHALQDQHTDLAGVVSARADGDGVMAVNCVVEGHAVWVHEQVGQRLGHTDAVALVAAIHGYDPALPGLPDVPERFYTSYVYGQGRAFVAWHHAEHGPEQAWRLLREPPASSAMILAPETYAPTLGAPWSPEVRDALRRERRRLGRSRWRGTDERIGDFDLREHLIDRFRDDALAEHLEAAWRSRGTGDEPMLGIELQLLAFRSELAARLYVRLMQVNAQLQLDALLPPIAMIGGVDGTVDDFDALASDVAAREAITLEIDGHRQALATVWIARGRHVMQVVTVNHPVPDRRLARAADRVLRLLE